MSIQEWRKEIAVGDATATIVYHSEEGGYWFPYGSRHVGDMYVEAHLTYHATFTEAEAVEAATQMAKKLL